MIKKVYVIELSNKRSIQIDEDELPKVIAGIQKGSPVIVRQGIFNPSFYVDIVSDEAREAKLRSATVEIEKHNEHDLRYNEGRDQRQIPGFSPLKNIFENVRLLPDGTSRTALPGA